MNLFGTFFYGNIIKTFIPGVFFTAALVLLIDDYNYWINNKYLILYSAADNPIISTALLIPCSIFMGIVSNSLCFSLIIPKYIEQPFKNANSDFIDYKKQVIEEMKDHYMELLKTPDALKESFRRNIDVRSFLLNKKDLSTLQYLRESYWYFMEFQINSIVTISLLTIGGLINILLRYNADATAGNLVFPYIVVTLLSVYLLFKTFIMAARENYEKHERKSLSYLQGAYHICRYGN